MKAYDIHPDFLQYQRMKPPLRPALLPVLNAFLTRAWYRTPIHQSLRETRHTIQGYRGAPLRLCVIRPETDAALLALVYLHGGAFALQAAPYLKRLLAEYAAKTHCTVVFVDYHLLPKATFPTGLEDGYAAYRWVVENAAVLGIDKSRIAIGGDSAGGALSIGVCLLAREAAFPMPCFQLLIYPVTDERQTSQSMREFADTPLWNSKQNAKMWKLYLRDGLPREKAFASPAEAASLAGLPPCYVEVAQFDCLRDEGVAFAEALRASGVPVALHRTRRTVHGYEIAEQNEIVRENVARRIERLRTAFYA